MTLSHTYSVIEATRAPDGLLIVGSQRTANALAKIKTEWVVKIYFRNEQKSYITTALDRWWPLPDASSPRLVVLDINYQRSGEKGEGDKGTCWWDKEEAWGNVSFSGRAVEPKCSQIVVAA